MESFGSTPFEQLAAALRSEPELPENVRIAIQEVLSRTARQVQVEGDAPTELGAGVVAAPDPIGATPMAEGPGTKIGRYKLLQLIGEGGFGSVFMAEQNHPVKRRVALKIIKLGMDTRQVVARFEAERQALAMMEHPNIARVLDAGSTDTGRPYFVMELVKGVPIVEFCDREKLSARNRLELFVCVCNAVQHAHQKGIIHRDLKPTNILVTIADGVPIPKVIDFGIAKATTGQLTDKTLYTEFRQLIGTPEYMSPEQAEMSGVDIDTRSDIYSLGVLLYQLLTGTTPFDANELRTRGHAEIQRLIREVEPPSPSTRLTTMNQEALANIARQRQVEPERLRKLMRGELDWIVMKCLEKDRTRRYETANGLAKDVLRYLNDEAIVARPASRAYRLKKFAHKHKAETIGAASVVAALLLALAGISIGLVKARLNLDAARGAERRAQTSEAQVMADRDRLAESEHRARGRWLRSGLRRRQREATAEAPGGFGFRIGRGIQSRR